MTKKQIQTISKDLSNAPSMFFKGRQMDAFALLHNAVSTMFENQLSEMYEAEFETIDGCRQHRNGLTFEEWRRSLGIE